MATLSTEALVTLVLALVSAVLAGFAFWRSGKTPTVAGALEAVSGQMTDIERATQSAREFIDGDQEALQRIQYVADVIAGFETPYGLELLTSIHWLAIHEDPRVTSPEAATDELQRWNPRKGNMFHLQHVRVAWQRLRETTMIASDRSRQQVVPV